MNLLSVVLLLLFIFMISKSFNERYINLGKASQHQVRLVLNATRMPDIKGACRITPAQSYREAKSTVGTVPIDCPYRMIFDGLMPYRDRSALYKHFRYILADIDLKKKKEMI